MLFLSLKRQSEPPKKQSSDTTFWRNPSLEFAFYLVLALMASSMVEWIWALISEVEREPSSVLLLASSPDSTRAAWTKLEISWMCSSVSTVVLSLLASTALYY
jgi:hypothetical protein